MCLICSSINIKFPLSLLYGSMVPVEMLNLHTSFKVYSFSLV